MMKKNKYKNVINTGLVAALIYTAGHLGTMTAHVLATSRSQRIADAAQLEQIVAEEKINQGLSAIPTTQSIRWIGDFRTASRVYKVDHGYEMVFDKYEGNTRTHVRHELCHIKYGDTENNSGKIQRLKYLFLEEPQAILCSL